MAKVVKVEFQTFCVDGDSEQVDTYEGNIEASLSPNEQLLILRDVPDVGNQNNGNPTKELVAIYNKAAWDKVTIE